jgi:uncharacterized protein (DUF488 family)
MDILTSYFAMVKNLPENTQPISISRFSPKFFKGPCYTKLAPTSQILKLYKAGVIDDNAYIQMYYDQVLSTLNAYTVVDELLAIAGNKIPVLVCYESPDKFCHRHLLNEWFNEIVDVEEFVRS